MCNIDSIEFVDQDQNPVVPKTIEFQYLLCGFDRSTTQLYFREENPVPGQKKNEMVDFQMDVRYGFKSKGGKLQFETAEWKNDCPCAERKEFYVSLNDIGSTFFFTREQVGIGITDIRPAIDVGCRQAHHIDLSQTSIIVFLDQNGVLVVEYSIIDEAEPYHNCSLCNTDGENCADS